MTLVGAAMSHIPSYGTLCYGREGLWGIMHYSTHIKLLMEGYRGVAACLQSCAAVINIIYLGFWRDEVIHKRIFEVSLTSHEWEKPESRDVGLRKFVNRARVHLSLT